MTDPPLFPVADDDGGDGTPREPLGTLTVEDDLSPGTEPAPGSPAEDAQAGSQAGSPADDYQADEAHDWTGGPPS